jgi:hypothetical protein
MQDDTLTLSQEGKLYADAIAADLFMWLSDYFACGGPEH